MLWQIVQEIFSSLEPKNFSNDFLLNTLKAMFEKPNVEASIWKSQSGRYGLAKVKSWKLLESYRVNIITLTTTQMILLVERRYPLTRFTLDQMLNNTMPMAFLKHVLESLREIPECGHADRPAIDHQIFFLKYFQVGTIDNKIVINIGLNNGRIRSRCYSLSTFPHRLIIEIENYLFGFDILFRLQGKYAKGLRLLVEDLMLLVQVDAVG
nr:hypothetical protein [Tanacetum cinerariifolium]